MSTNVKNLIKTREFIYMSVIFYTLFYLKEPMFYFELL